MVWGGAAAGGHASRATSAVAVREDIQKRVAVAGGNSLGVLVASLSWTTPDDLDLHVVVPGGGEISYQRRRVAGGELDVDMCVHGRGKMCTANPVENVVFSEVAPAGRYKVYVQNFNFHANYLSKDAQVARMQDGQNRAPTKEERDLRLGKERPVLFDLLVKVEDSYTLFQGLCTPRGKTHKQSDVLVFEFDYAPGSEGDDGLLRPVFKRDASTDGGACEEHGRKLRELSGRSSGDDRRRGLPSGATNGGGNLPRGSGDGGGSGGAGRRSGTAPAAARPSTAGSRGSGRKARDAAGRQSARRDAALSAVRAASRVVLASKPTRALQSLLSDLGVQCRGCLEKEDIVARLLDAAGSAGDEL